MSTYKAITLHPLTGFPELATWHDDYYGEHKYAVEFPSDDKIFPAENCKEVKITKALNQEGNHQLISNLTETEKERIIAFLLHSLGLQVN